MDYIAGFTCGYTPSGEQFRYFLAFILVAAAFLLVARFGLRRIKTNWLRTTSYVLFGLVSVAAWHLLYWALIGFNLGCNFFPILNQSGR